MEKELAIELCNGGQWEDKSFKTDGEHAHIIPFSSTNCWHIFSPHPPQSPENNFWLGK